MDKKSTFLEIISSCRLIQYIHASIYQQQNKDFRSTEKKLKTVGKIGCQKNLVSKKIRFFFH